MTNSSPDSIESIVRNPLVGIDGEGCEHRFDRYHDIVYVLDGETVERVQKLDPGELPDWVDYVAGKRGWDDCRYFEGNLLAAMADRLADALEAGS